MNQLDPLKLRVLIDAFYSLVGVREAARYASCAKQTAMKAYQRIAAMGYEINPDLFVGSRGRMVLRCKCGMPSTHRGWCSFRFSRSADRKAFMDRWRNRQ